MLAPHMVLTIALSTPGGAIVGGLPGLTATMAVALLVPFTFTLGPAVGLVAIGRIYVGAMYGGAIPACLINTPGTPSALATTFDGFPSPVGARDSTPWSRQASRPLRALSSGGWHCCCYHHRWRSSRCDSDRRSSSGSGCSR